MIAAVKKAWAAFKARPVWGKVRYAGWLVLMLISAGFIYAGFGFHWLADKLDDES